MIDLFISNEFWSYVTCGTNLPQKCLKKNSLNKFNIYFVFIFRQNLMDEIRKGAGGLRHVKDEEKSKKPSTDSRSG